MTKETADRLCDALDEIGAEYTRMDDYSGRGMYGKTTVGVVVGSWQTLLRAVAVAAGRATDADPGREFQKELGRLRDDSMARDIVVY